MCTIPIQAYGRPPAFTLKLSDGESMGQICLKIKSAAKVCCLPEKTYNILLVQAKQQWAGLETAI